MNLQQGFSVSVNVSCLISFFTYSICFMDNAWVHNKIAYTGDLFIVVKAHVEPFTHCGWVDDRRMWY